MLCGANVHKGRLPEEAAALEGSVHCDFEIASERLAQCVVGMQERWTETVELVLPRWFPWLDVGAGVCDRTEGNRRVWRAERSREDLPEPIREVLRQHNACDMRLYELGAQIFERQLDVARAASAGV